MRLQGIALEQSFRIKAATLAAEQDILDLQNKLVKEVMSEQVISALSSQYQNSLNVSGVESKTQGIGVKMPGSISSKPTGPVVNKSQGGGGFMSGQKDPFAKVVEVNKASSEINVAAINTTGKLQETKLTQGIEKQTKLLSETAYTIKLQQEMVAMLGINASLLQQISDNTTNDTTVNINGKVLSQTLLNQARRSYGVARTA